MIKILKRAVELFGLNALQRVCEAEGEIQRNIVTLGPAYKETMEYTRLELSARFNDVLVQIARSILKI